MSCTNKGCGKTQEPYLDIKTDKVYCSECDKEMTNVSYFTKVQMKSLKQFKIKKNDSYSVKCSKCQHVGRPKLIKDQFICDGCSQPLDNLSYAFKIMLKDKLKNEDIGDIASENNK
jgi:rRNA maturation endonuclease Nob1